MLNRQTSDVLRENKSVKINIEDAEFVSRSEMNEAMALANSIELEQMNDKLINFYGWSNEDVSLMSDYYKKWLSLHVCYPELAIAPSIKLDEYWHMHILDTQKYMEDCQMIFGRYLHHYPYFGLEGDKEELNNGFTLTNKLFEHHFSHGLTGFANPCSSTACR
ncbi:MAG: Unknown protein [uncultured Sulfurovum sp.]|uniref:Glycine-rich domain-containing protein-like n=1 Tax=uncultured Sulfurovum sp. TaxID=269237 RepID=A0A6S6T3D0_9BACT|nr:MAG: Unknown protein [uncultured Sulfurovum sp.]